MNSGSSTNSGRLRELVTRRLLELPVAGALRNYLALRNALRDSWGSKKMAAKLEYGNLDVTDGSLWARKSDTLFILGSGPSVEEVSQDQWAHVAKHNSIGINSWVVHDFVPDIYCFEEVESLEYATVASALSAMLARSDILKRAPQILLLRPHADTESQRIVQVPPSLRRNTKVYGRATVSTKSVSNLVSDLSRLMRSYRSGRVQKNILLDSGMSVARMLFLGAVSGFSTIVLIGVDLNSNQYFFDVNPNYLGRRNQEDFDPWRRRSRVHDTEDRISQQFQASQFIPALAQAAEKTFGTQVLISSHESLLSATMQLYRWK